MRERDQQKAPASEVVRNSEDQLQRVATLRRRAADLLVEAARLQQETHDFALAELGPVNGAAAYNLACMSADIDPDMRGAADDVTPPEAAVPVVAEARQVARIAAPPVPVIEPLAEAVSRSVVVPPVPITATIQRDPVPTRQADDDPSRMVLYGVEVKRSKAAEAAEVVDQAKSAAARRHKHNPYAIDRGRNAWRNALFVAALAAEASGQSEAAVETQDEVDTEVNTDREALDGTVGPREAVVEVSVSDPVDSTPHPSSGDVLDDTSEDGPAATDNVVSRAVPYTQNAAQEVPVNRGSAAPSSTPPPFVRPATVPDLHVSRPITGRVVAHGQASPMPEGLKGIPRADAGKPSTPVTPIKPAAIRTPLPSFLRKDPQ